jgi:hypothetical protein
VGECKLANDTPPRVRLLQTAGRHRQMQGALDLGHATAMNEKSAITRPTELFNISFANRSKLVVTKIELPRNPKPQVEHRRVLESAVI